MMNTPSMHLDDVSTSELEMMPSEIPQSETVNTAVQDEREMTVLNEADMRSAETIAPTFISQLEIKLIAIPQSESGNTAVKDDREITVLNEEIISDPEAKDINLGLIQMVISKCCYATDRVAITAAIVIAIATNLLDGFGDVGLSASLFWSGDIEGAITLLSIDYLAVVLTIIHFTMTKAYLNMSWIVRVLECTLLIMFHPIAPSITMIFWLVARYKQDDQISDHFHIFTKTIITMTATFEAPLQVIATTCLSLSGRLPSPWNNQEQFCDNLGNCLPKGYFTIFVYCVSWLALIKASIEAFQVGNKVTLLAFLLTTIIFRISCFIFLATYATFWSVFILIPLVLINLVIVSRYSHQTQTGVHILTSVVCSIFVTTVIPEDPSKKEKTGESSINQDSAVFMASLMSLCNILIIFVGTTIVFLLVQYSPTFNVDPCIELDRSQLRFIFFYFSIPLFILSMMVIFWFYITQTKTDQPDQQGQRRCRIPRVKIHKIRYLENVIDLLFLLCLFALIVCCVILCGKREEESKCSKGKKIVK